MPRTHDIPHVLSGKTTTVSRAGLPRTPHALACKCGVALVRLALLVTFARFARCARCRVGGFADGSIPTSDARPPEHNLWMIPEFLCTYEKTHGDHAKTAESMRTHAGIFPTPGAFAMQVRLFLKTEAIGERCPGETFLESRQPFELLHVNPVNDAPGKIQLELSTPVCPNPGTRELGQPQRRASARVAGINTFRAVHRCSLC
eukprot:gene25592-biopygen1465